MRRTLLAFNALVALAAARAHDPNITTYEPNATTYEPNWPSLMARPLPSWFDDAKVGIFLHWGVFSVPSFGSEWYWYNLNTRKDPATVAFHNATYGPDFAYAQFAPQFTATFFNATAWASLFKDAGIRYVVLTSKHHEGFTNWCSAEAFSWNACEDGPKRNLVAELAGAVRAVGGVRMGLYHSIFEWYHPLYLADKAANYTTRRYVDEVYYPQAQDLNRLYRPDLIWSDGDWEANSSYWRSPELLAWLYNDGAGSADTVVVNDRWVGLCLLARQRQCSVNTLTPPPTPPPLPGQRQPANWQWSPLRRLLFRRRPAARRPSPSGPQVGVCLHAGHAELGLRAQRRAVLVPQHHHGSR